VIFELTR